MPLGISYRSGSRKRQRCHQVNSDILFNTWINNGENYILLARGSVRTNYCLLPIVSINMNGDINVRTNYCLLLIVSININGDISVRSNYSIYLNNEAKNYMLR